VEYRGDLDYLRTYIHHLRQKIEPDPAHPSLILRVRGAGYMLTCQEHTTLASPPIDHRIPAS
jgi:DNA-binding response OmpR family regulator